MADQLTPEQWATVLGEVEPPTHGEVPLALEDRLDLAPEQAWELVEDALDDGVIAEDDSGVFTTLVVSERAEGGEETPETETETDPDDSLPRRAHEAFEVAIEYFHEQLDRELPEVAGFDTARDYYRDGRGWTDETIDEKRLGYAPTDASGLIDRLMREGFGRDEILGTGLFYGNLDAHFRGRYVLPYFNEDNEPVYAISRSLAEHDGGHPNDPKGDQKYTKAVKTKDYSHVDEPIFGIETVDENTERLLAAGGIADAITLHQAGYACISPVTTVQFKNKHKARVIELVETYDVERVYMINDQERPNINVTDRDDPERITDVLGLMQVGDGTRGAFANAEFLTEAGIPTYLAELPLPAETDEFHKVDPADFITGGWGSIEAVIASAKPAGEHPAYQKWIEGRQQRALSQASREATGERSAPDRTDATTSGLYALAYDDVTGLREGFRGENPVEDHGSRDGYFTVVKSNGELMGYDHKWNVGYNALTHLLCAAGHRRADAPNGSLDEEDHLVAWVEAKKSGVLPSDDPIPTKARVNVALSEGLCERDDVEDGWKLPAEAYNGMLEAVEEKYGVDPGRPKLTSGSGSRGAGRFVEECEPPADAHAEPLDVEARRADMGGETYDQFTDRDELTIWAYNPGEGKTTSATLAAADRDRPFVVALPKHENCRQFQKDDVKPDGMFHLKGAAQPIGDECMDASIAERDCSDHGHPSECPSMCPVYDLDSDHPIRVLFDVFAAAGKSRKAHAILGLFDEPWHGETCEWLDQWDAVESADRIVTVHNYLTMKTVREHGDILIDDAAGSFAEDATVKVDALTRCRSALSRYARYADDDRVADAFRLLSVFVDDFTDALLGVTDGEEARDAIDELDVPAFPATTRTYDTREEIPEHVPESAITETRRKEYVGEGGQYDYERAYEVETNDLAETLAQVRHVYEETVVGNMREGSWNGTPLCLDAVYGVLARVATDEADARAAQIAAGTDGVLEACPVCESHLAPMDGKRVCTECGWDEDGRLVQDDAVPARIDVDVATTNGGNVEGLAVRTLPPIAALPNVEDVLVLDATPRKDVYAAVFGVDSEAVVVEGNDAYSMPNVNTTMFADGAYHLSTIVDSPVARKKIQETIDKVDAMHDDVVYVAPRKARDLFDWPGDTTVVDVLYYYALRGLDAMRGADAIVLIGAPHPDENDLRAEARLLSINNPGVRVGGREFSTRSGKEDDPNDTPGDPEYRKLNYVDDDGNGRKIAAKTYSGITGDLFDSRHADELEQAAHRIRPLLVDEDDEKHIYMLTNVPTRLPIDELTTFDDFHDPLGSAVDVRDSSRDLLDAMVESAHDAENDAPYVTDGGILSVAGTKSEWKDAAERAGLDMAERTLYAAIKELRDAGLVEEGDYVQRRGRLKRITRRGAAIVSVSR